MRKDLDKPAIYRRNPHYKASVAPELHTFGQPRPARRSVITLPVIVVLVVIALAVMAGLTQ